MVSNPLISASTLLNDTGPLAETIPGYQVRAAQIRLAELVENALDQQSVLIAEAGTGTGKTFAYLLPALLSGKKVLVSTGTKNLQDQLFLRDMPVLRQAMTIKAKTALLKGRANYLCLYRLQANAIDARFISKEMVAHYQFIQEWAKQTQFGDIAELTAIPEDAEVWPTVTSTADNCLNTDCPHYNDCFLVKARRQAQEADVVVINHHLFFADLALREEGFAELLPAFEAVIFDEAHQIPDIAGQFFGRQISSRQLMDFINDTVAEAHALGKDMPDLTDATTRLQYCVNDLRFEMGTQIQRAAWQTIATQKPVQKAIESVSIYLKQLCEVLETFAGRSKGLEACHERAQLLAEKFALLTSDTPNQQIHWFETFKKSFSIHHTPMSIAQTLQETIYKIPRTWIFTSATLAVEKSFSHFQQEMGLTEATTEQLASPFDYEKQTLMYLPRGLPDNKSKAFVDDIIQKAIPVIKACGGRTFFLFTSHAALQYAASILAEELDFPLFVQGERAKGQLINDFVIHGNAVLLGTNSFWEGVDVRGKALSCVIIDKLPFASPGDPILKARIDALRQQGKEPFNDYQLPSAIIQLRQGIGRLIRDVDDKGIIMICDPRLSGRAYGENFIKSFPKMPITRDAKRVLEFIESLALDSEAATT